MLQKNILLVAGEGVQKEQLTVKMANEAPGRYQQHGLGVYSVDTRTGDSCGGWLLSTGHVTLMSDMVRQARKDQEEERLADAQWALVTFGLAGYFFVAEAVLCCVGW